MSTRAIERKVMVPQRLVTAQGKTLAPEVSQLHQAVLKLADAHNYHDDQLMRTLRGGVSASNNALVKYVTLSVQMPADAPWLPMSPLTNGWTATGGYDAPGYLMEPGGHASTRGVISGGTSNSAAFKLVGYGPAVKRSFPAGLDVIAELRVFANGLLTPIFAAGSPQVSLSHSWIAAPAAAGIAGPAVGPHAFPAPWPVVVQHGFDQCLNLDVVACVEDSQSARVLAPLGIPVWQDVGNGQLRLDGLWGLQWGKKYQVRLRLSGEA